MRTHLGMIAVLVSACTGDIGSDPGDGSGSNPPPPPPATDVRITVQDGYVPQPNVRVLYQNADGSTFMEVATDASGVADLDFPSGNVTVIRTFPPAPPPATVRPAAVYTYVGVKAGDRLVLGDEMETNTAMLSAVNVAVPATAQGTVSLQSGCGTGTGSAPLVPMSVGNCPAQVVFYGEDQGGSSFVYHSTYSDHIDISAAPLSNTLNTSFSSANAGPDVQAVSVEARIVDGTYSLWSTGARQTPTNTDMPNVQGVDELLIEMIQTNGGNQLIGTRQQYAVTPVTVDVATAPLLPYVSTTTFAPTGVSWAEQGTGTADFVLARLDVTPTTAPAYTRVIIAPHNGMSLPLPLLQGADATYNPSAADQIAGTHAIGKAVGGYDSARSRAFAVTSFAQTAPMNGTVTLSYAGNAPTLGPN